jgi:signal transduction histidine kinase
MTRPSATRSGPWVLLGLVCVATAVSSAFAWRDEGVGPLIGLAAAAIGTLILVRTGNRIGWLFDAAAVSTCAIFLTEAYVYVSSTRRTPLAGVGVAAILNKVAVYPVVPAFALLLLLFPSGRPPSRRWTPVGWLLVASTILVTAFVLVQPGPTGANHAAGIPNPLGLPAFGDLAQTLATVGGQVMAICAIACIVSLVVRFRRAVSEERQQIRWLVYAGTLGIVSFFLSGIGANNGQDSVFSNIAWFAFVASVAIGFPVAVTVAILKYRLYDIDVVVSKTIVYGTLAAFTTLVYVVVVVLVGEAIGIGSYSLPLSIAATAVVAVAFQPLRERFQRLANRLVYGARATPYEVLARFSDRIGEAYATEHVLPRMARVLFEGVHAASAVVWLRLADRFEPAASWPAETDPGAPSIPAPAAGALPLLPGDHVAPVRYRDELLGALSIDRRPDEPLRPAQVALLEDLASQAGLVLANVRMTADLEARLRTIERQAAELKASRQRIVAAQDAERRRLERNIHDGAQQHLVALAVKLRLAKGLLSKDPRRARSMLVELQGEVDDALDTIHALALGIYPPLLEEQGIAAALADQYRRAGLPVRLHADGLTRHPIEVEAAVYFCVLEALQNTAKYARAAEIDVTLAQHVHELAFEVRDDGVGFDPPANGNGTGLAGMRDRLAVLGGDARLESAPGRGTVVSGRVPLDGEEALT